MGDIILKVFSELDHIFLEDLHRAKEAASDPPNDSSFSNPFVFDNATLAGNVDPTEAPDCLISSGKHGLSWSTII